MLQTHKTAFSNLLTKIDAIDIGPSLHCDDNLYTIFKDVEDEYRRIQRGTLSKLEDLRIVSDALKKFYYSARDRDVFGALSVVEAKLSSSQLMLHDIQDALDRINLKKGKWLFEEERIDEALDTWEKVLDVRLGKKIHNYISSSKKFSPKYYEVATKTHRKYYFKYLGQLTRRFGVKAVSLASCKTKRFLIAADHFDNKIYKFDITGNLIDIFDLQLPNPFVGFIASDSTIWIHNRECSTYLELTSSGDIKSKISANDILTREIKNKYTILTDYTAEDTHNNHYYIIARKNFYQTKIYSYNRETSVGRVLDCNLKRPGMIQIYGDYMYLVNFISQTVLYMYNLSNNVLKKIVKLPMGNLKRFELCNRYFYIVIDFYLYKYSISGEIIFCADLRNYIKNEHLKIDGIATLSANNRNFLYLLDSHHNCIHSFQI